MRRFPRRPSPAMVVALIALIAATGGSAIADGVSAVAAKVRPSKNTVTSKHVVNGSLLLADFKKSERSKLVGPQGPAGAPGATGPQGPQGIQGPQGPAGTPDGYTKSEADGKFLEKTAKAADAETLDGIDSSGFIQGRGVTVVGARLLDSTGSGQETLITIPDLGAILVTCAGASENMTVIFDNQSGGSVRYSRFSTLHGALGNVDGGITSSDLDMSPGTNDAGITLQLHRSTGFGAFTSVDAATVFITALNNPTGETDTASKCRFQAHAITHEAGNSTPIVILP